jgi:hypothetical protein
MHYHQPNTLSRRLGALTIPAFLAAMWICLPSGGPCAQSNDDWEQSPEAQRFEQKEEAGRAALVRLNGNGTDLKLKAELLAMGKVDQDIRTRMFALPSAQQSALVPELQKTDATLTEKLKQIVARYGWPVIAYVGIEASQAAALILIHSPDHVFQRNLLPELQKLVEEKKIIGSDLALLVDKTLVAEGKPQRFGTQFSWTEDGPAVMDPVEDPAHLDERREMYLLPPMSLYKRMLGSAYQRKVQ